MAAPSTALALLTICPRKVSATNSSALTIPAGVFVVYDTASGLQRSQPAVRTPTTGDTALKTYAGFSYTDALAGDVFDICCMTGDVVIATANGTVAIGDPITVSSDSAKLGWGKTLGASAGLVLVGYAMTAASNAGLFACRLSGTNVLP